jgi:DNA end-binding protein Ku
MAPRANWKGFLKLSLVSCPVALFPATSQTEKISFNQINKNTGHRIKYSKVDAETGDERGGYHQWLQGRHRHLRDCRRTNAKIWRWKAPARSTSTNSCRGPSDELYLVRPYYIVPDGKVGHDAYAVIRKTIRTMDKVAIARVVLTNREHIISLEAREKGLVGTLLRYPKSFRTCWPSSRDFLDAAS